MKKCLRVIINSDFPSGFLHDFLQKNAREMGLEGSAQFMASDQIRVVVCGEKEVVDQFLDVLFKGTEEWYAENIVTEPFVKDKDYRGVFRVIE